jgi:glycosyltransferase involved in cell wall biosynthesis
MKDLTIIVPFYNESGSLRQIQKKINYNFRESKKIFLDDGSTDNSIEKLKKNKNTKIVSNSKNSGYGFSLKKGVSLSKTKYVAWFDADNEHKVEDLLKMYKKIKKDNLDALIGTRLNLRRSLVNVLGKKIIRLFSFIMGFKLPFDFNCGLRIFKREKILIFNHQLSNRFSASTSSLIFLIFHKMNYEYFSIFTSKRIGQTKVKFIDGFRTVVIIFKLSLILGVKKYFFLTGLAVFIFGVHYSWNIFLEGAGLSPGSILLLILGFVMILISYIFIYQDYK